MKALVLSEHGDLDKLGLVKDKPVPQPGDGEVLVRVGASSFNYHDIFTVRGMPGIRVPLPVVIGLDIAGTVVEDAGEWKAGDRVMVNPLRAGIGLMGEMVDGGMEEYVVNKFPQSDLEMMQGVLPKYLDQDKPFNLYFMSVSGHSV